MTVQDAQHTRDVVAVQDIAYKRCFDRTRHTTDHMTFDTAHQPYNSHHHCHHYQSQPLQRTKQHNDNSTSAPSVICRCCNTSYATGNHFNTAYATRNNSTSCSPLLNNTVAMPWDLQHHYSTSWGGVGNHYNWLRHRPSLQHSFRCRSSP